MKITTKKTEKEESEREEPEDETKGHIKNNLRGRKKEN